MGGDGSQPKPWPAIVSATCAVVTTVLKFADALPQLEPWITLAALLFGLAALILFFVPIGKWFRRRAKAKALETLDRDEADWYRFRDALVELVGISRSVIDVIDSGVLDPEAPGPAARALLKAVLIRAQRAVEKLCPDVVCSIKLLKKERNAPLSLECLYVDGGSSAKYDALVRRFRTVSYQNSYSGRALERNDFLFVPDLWSVSQESLPFSAQDAADLRRLGVEGIVIAPVSLVKEGKQEAKFVFKVDLFRKNGLVDNEPTRRLLEWISAQCAFVFKLAVEMSNAFNRERDVSDEST